ncbi:hypothetical protein BDV95DRAFT_251930 [Massariosphaeria phaeospora]|uniref:Transcription factor CBF/NF-Y/archaeal histone domain-containing protein n=1 Tax=Massariosphaeria phaeospora TaxID=100035 RepID=A0A7C8M083_9PLEO|nr:hypothetical protein BDV95DRAFT_251930 [Massariosphaeria phaeospora]
MAPAAKPPYPRATLRKTLRAHTNQPLSKNVDILVFLNYALFMQRLIREAGIAGKQAGGSAGVTARSVRKVRGDCLRGFRG